MAVWLAINGNTSGWDQFDATRYWAIIGALNSHTTEARAPTLVRDSYTIANLYVRILSNTATGASTVVDRINYGNGTVTVSIPAGTSGVFQDLANSDGLVNGDLVNNRIDRGVSGTIKPSVIAYTLTTPDDVPILEASYTSGRGIACGTTTYSNISGLFNVDTDETKSQYRFRVASTLSKFRVNISSNTLNGASTVRPRVNGANVNQVVNIGAGASGSFEDGVNTDAVASGDLLSYQIATGGTTGSMGVSIIQVRSNSIGQQICMGDAGAMQTTGSSISYTTIGGLSAYSNIESDAQVAAQASLVMKNMFVRVVTNGLSSASYFRLRKNSANGNLVVSVPATSTGAFEDLVNIDNLIAADIIDWLRQLGGQPFEYVTVTYIGGEINQPSAPPPAGTEGKSAFMASKMVGAGLI